MTPEEWAARIILANDHPKIPVAILLPGGRQVHLDDSDYPEFRAGLATLVRAAVAGVIRSAVAEALNSGMPGVPLSAGELEAVRARAEAATPGPWVDTSTSTAVGPIVSPGYSEICLDPDGDDRENDRAFIATARQDVPALLAHIDHLDALFRDLSQDPAHANMERVYRGGYGAGKAEAIGLLRGLEWCGARLPDTQPPGEVLIYFRLCPVCHEQEPGPHEAGCRMAKVLGG